MSARIVRNRDWLGGAPRIDGTRISARQVVRMDRSEGRRWVLDQFPTLTDERVSVAIRYWRWWGWYWTGRDRMAAGLRVLADVVQSP